MFVAAPINRRPSKLLKVSIPIRNYPVLPNPEHDAPKFNDQHVQEALFSFAPTCAAGLFGYRPSILQQCARAESFHFLSTLTQAVNLLASGNGPSFLQPFLAGECRLRLLSLIEESVHCGAGPASQISRQMFLFG